MGNNQLGLELSEWQRQESGNLRDLLSVLFKYYRTIVTVFVVTVCTVTLASFLVPPTYEAGSTLLVKLGRDYVYRPEVGETKIQIPQNLIAQDEVINSEIEILRSRDLLEKVISTLGVDKMYPAIAEDPPTGMTPLQAAVLKLRKNLKIEGIKKSNVISITFTHKYPSIAANMVNLLAELYRAKHLKIFGDTNLSFLENALNDYDLRLRESETRIQSFKQKHQIVLFEEQKRLLLSQRMEFDTALKNSQIQINELQERLASLQGQAKAIAAEKYLYTFTERDKIIVESKAKLLSLKLDEKELLLKYKEDNPIVVKIRDEIDLVERFLTEQEEEITTKVKSGNLVYQDAERQIIVTLAGLKSLLAKAPSLQRQLSAADIQLRELDALEKELVGLTRDRDANEKNYKIYLEKLEEARIADEMNRQKIANVTVINQADIPVKPIWPKKTLNIILSIIFGMVSGVGLAFVRENLSQSISTPMQAEKRLGLKVLACISSQKGPG